MEQLDEMKDDIKKIASAINNVDDLYRQRLLDLVSGALLLIETIDPHPKE